jgi:hypothetical protein
MGPRWPRYPETKKVPMPVKYYEIPPDGIVIFDLDIPTDAVSFDIAVSKC